MDPISILGAAGSVVGIAGFGIQLSQVLYNFVAQARSANVTLQALIDGVNATTSAMDQVRGLLEDEKKHIESGHTAVLFNAKALDDVKGRADQCLIIFWRIEAVITKNGEPRDFEEQLALRLEAFNNEIKAKKEPRLPMLDTGMILSKLQALKWTYVAPKLEQFSKDLDRIQLNLVLMFQVISMKAKTIKLKLTEEDMQFLRDSSARIQRIAQRADFSDIFSVSSYSRFPADHYRYAERYPFSSRQIENSIDSEYDVYPFMRQRFSYRGNPSPQRHFPSNKDGRRSPTPQRMAVGSQRRHQNPSSAASRVHRQPSERQPSPVRRTTADEDDGVVENRIPITVQRSGSQIISPAQMDISDVNEREEEGDGGKEPKTRGSKEPQPKVITVQPKKETNQQIPKGKEADKSSRVVYTKDSPEPAPSFKTQQNPKQNLGVENSSLSSTATSPEADQPAKDKQQLNQSSIASSIQNHAKFQDKQNLSQPGSVEPQPNTESRFVIFGAAKLHNIQLAEPRASANIQDISAVQSSVITIDPLNLPALSNTAPESASVRETTSRDGSESTKRSAVNKQRDLHAPISITGNIGAPSVTNVSLRSGGGSKAEFDSGFSTMLARIKAMFPKDIVTEFDEELESLEVEITAYVIRNGESHIIPHSGRLGLKKSHAKNLFIQPQSQDWFKTFAFLDADEMAAIDRILRSEPDSMMESSLRKLIQLERIRKARLKFWGRSEKSLLAIVGSLPISSEGSFSKRSSVSRHSSLSVRVHSVAGNAEEIPKRNQQSPLVVSAQPTSTSTEIPNPTVPAALHSHPQTSSGRPSHNGPHRTSVSASQTQTTNSVSPNPQDFSAGSSVPQPPPPPQIPQSYRYEQYSQPQYPASGGSQPPPLPQHSSPPMLLNPRLTRIQDLNLEADCRDHLTLYVAYTIMEAEAQEHHRENIWERCSVTQESLEPREVAKRVLELNNDGHSVMEKKANLLSAQQQQITFLIDAAEKHEVSSGIFRWTLAQLESPRPTTVEKQRKRSLFRLKAKPVPPAARVQPKVMIVYLRRAPDQGINCTELYGAIQNTKADMFSRSPPPPPLPLPQASVKQAGMSSNAQQNNPEVVRKSETAPKEKSKSTSKPTRRVRSDPYDDSNSDSDISLVSSISNGGTTVRYRTKHREKYRTPAPRVVTAERAKPKYQPGPIPQARYQSSQDIPRSSDFEDPFLPGTLRGYPVRRNPFRPEQNDRNGTLRTYEVPPPPARPPAFRSDRAVLERAERQYREDTDRFNQRYHEYDDDDDDSDYRELRRTYKRAPTYPEYYDRRPYHVQVEPQNDGDMDNNGQDIVSQLLLEWTPNPADAGDPEQDDEELVGRDVESETGRGRTSFNWKESSFSATTPDILNSRQGLDESPRNSINLTDSPQQLPADSEKKTAIPKEEPTHDSFFEKVRRGSVESLKTKGRVDSEPIKARKDTEPEFSQPRRSTTADPATQPAWLEKDYARRVVGQTKTSSIATRTRMGEMAEDPKPSFMTDVKSGYPTNTPAESRIPPIGRGFVPVSDYGPSTSRYSKRNNERRPTIDLGFERISQSQPERPIIERIVERPINRRTIRVPTYPEPNPRVSSSSEYPGSFQDTNSRRDEYDSLSSRFDIRERPSVSGPGVPRARAPSSILRQPQRYDSST